ncbi:MAG: magnesium/cobalt transporter CorA [Bdellovibrionota bacterium]
MIVSKKKWTKWSIEKRPSPGTAPGHTETLQELFPTTVHMLLYSPEHFELHQLKKNEPLEPWLEKAMSQQCKLWIHIVGLKDVKWLKSIFHTFSLHPLLVEDVFHGYQRPKFDRYENINFVTLRSFFFDPHLDSEQVSFVSDSKNFCISIQERAPDCFSPLMERLQNEKSFLRNYGAEFLFYSFFDTIVDSFFPILETIGDQIEDIEIQMLSNPKNKQLIALYEFKSQLIQLRKAAWSQSDALDKIVKNEEKLELASEQVFFRDCQDHAHQILDLIDNFKDMSNGLMELHFSVMNNKLNQTMKILTMIATIFIPLSFITSFYGMNFNPTLSWFTMPELRWRYGYPMALTLMVGTVAGMVMYFRKINWFGSSED